MILLWSLHKRKWEILYGTEVLYAKFTRYTDLSKFPPTLFKREKRACLKTDFKKERNETSLENSISTATKGQENYIHDWTSQQLAEELLEGIDDEKRKLDHVKMDNLNVVSINMWFKFSPKTV